MSEPLLTLLIFTPVIGAVIATFAAWRYIRHHALFAVVALLVLLGLQGGTAPIAIGYLLPSGAGLTAAAANDAFFRSVAFNAAVQVVVGSLVLWWLARALRKP